jgi:hypothetical protein
VFEHSVLRRIFRPKRDEVTGDWRKLHNEELNDQYCSHIIVRVIKSSKRRWVWYVARMGDRRGVYRGHAVGQLVEALRHKPKVRGFDSGWYHWHYGPGVDSASNRMSTRNISWEVKAAGA